MNPRPELKTLIFFSSIPKESNESVALNQPILERTQVSKTNPWLKMKKWTEQSNKKQHTNESEKHKAKSLG